MPYSVKFTANADREFTKLEHETKLRIMNALERVRFRPESYLIKLVGEDAYRLRVGDYRIIVELLRNELVVLVIKVGHRRKIYKR